MEKLLSDEIFRLRDSIIHNAHLNRFSKLLCSIIINEQHAMFKGLNPPTASLQLKDFETYFLHTSEVEYFYGQWNDLNTLQDNNFLEIIKIELILYASIKIYLVRLKNNQIIFKFFGLFSINLGYLSFFEIRLVCKKNKLQKLHSIKTFYSFKFRYLENFKMDFQIILTELIVQET
ncbi:hypothetical protein BpHYR1_027301 [Brachionus plicatilis]|uniref:Uncharacterized protein n=1 Tax=Brachionus plicatilis TaxID=10195 RepID=A0A3M7Q1K0_BRAPC|nr:hypothetical protein BpHYR1_027301 [Brachionus plicatilis]